jgi:hypothetical protein
VEERVDLLVLQIEDDIRLGKTPVLTGRTRVAKRWVLGEALA